MYTYGVYRLVFQHKKLAELSVYQQERQFESDLNVPGRGQPAFAILAGRVVVYIAAET